MIKFILIIALVFPFIANACLSTSYRHLAIQQTFATFRKKIRNDTRNQRSIKLVSIMNHIITKLPTGNLNLNINHTTSFLHFKLNSKSTYIFTEGRFGDHFTRKGKLHLKLKFMVYILLMIYQFSPIIMNSQTISARIPFKRCGDPVSIDLDQKVVLLNSS